jgi:hypothetical protein
LNGDDQLDEWIVRAIQSLSRFPTRKTTMSKLTIFPYLFEGACWVFDDQRAGLKEEAFVLGMTEMISKVVEAKAIPNADKGFALTFAAEPFDHDVELTWMSPAEIMAARNVVALPGVGNWYRGTICGEEMIGWLCPALFLYFAEAPKKIYAKAEPLPAGVDPIWHVDANDPIARRFMSASGEFQG